MYNNFYALEKMPFGTTSDPEFLYLSPSHREALAAITYGVEQRKGFILALAEIGLGKTAILRYYLATQDRARVTTAYIVNPAVSFRALLAAICDELGIANPPVDAPGMVNRLQQRLIEEYRQGRNVVLLVDEAQNMPLETLERLRLLSNIETSTDKLLQIVLVGQPELAYKLDTRALRQLKQRIAVCCTLDPLTDAQSRDYIEHRLNKAGASTASLFTPWAVRRIVKHAQGVPRVLNILCDNALVTGLGYREKPVTARIVREVIRDLRGRPGRRRPRWAWAAAAALLIVAIAAFLVSLYPGQSRLAAATTVTPRAQTPATAVSPATPPAPLDPAPVTTLIAAVSPARARTDDIERPQELLAVDQVVPLSGERPVVATRVVKEGDTLYHLTTEVYGFATSEVVQRVLDRNPGIADPDRILYGTTIRFPDIADVRARQPGATPQAQ
jgi:general secretion pathway protein A